MNGSDWTVEGELRGLAAQDDTRQALLALDLLDPSSQSYELRVVQDWHRSGAETYSLTFAVQSNNGEATYVMKACVAYSGGTPLKDIFAEWLTRRTAVQGARVSTPRLHATGNALLVEEFIPYSLTEALTATRERERLLTEVGATAARLLNAGFVPLSTHDWRSRGNDVVLVDFGQDLGPSKVTGWSEAGLLSDVLDTIARADIELSPSELRIVGESYERQMDA